MSSFAVIKTGGKQYLVKDNEEILVEKMSGNENDEVTFDALLRFSDDSDKIEVGGPALDKKIKGTIVGHVKGDKVRVAKFKSKVRYRRVTGFRPQLTKVKISL